MDSKQIIVINSGSSSIKFAVYDFSSLLKKRLHGVVENIHIKPSLKLFNEHNQLLNKRAFDQDTDYHFFYELLFSSLKHNQFGFDIEYVGHRVVHGGKNFKTPVIISNEVVERLKELIPFAPLHQPYNLEAISIISELYPHLKQIACFDTSFHTTHPFKADTFGIPRSLSLEGVKRYGFHGLSYEYIMHRLKELDTEKYNGRIIIAHLGNGASMCAVKNGQSIDSTMGFTALDGLVMGSRCGNLDPGVILYLLKSKKMSAAEVQTVLYKQSGLLGISGISSNMQQLLASENQAAKEAIDVFIYRIQREIGALTAVLGGLDMLVFTGGIGQNSWQIRESVCHKSQWLGIQIDPHLNKKNSHKISTDLSLVDIYAIPTDEEWIIANHCYHLIN
ncbi:acetate/propionate family kinase [Legionella brunensis]|uniref:Acetate kinase n=1 Tax=Legionella brunensis TaxID=29422 RepID=A0A0W0SMG0_9GAMM|nr:acetate/propionate family kinase [Legionella brunensis]KTC84449.1 Acetate kinase (Acetokinase) [Legionella brunensis]